MLILFLDVNRVTVESKVLDLFQFFTNLILLFN
jgi:hypothetical protein